MLRYSILLILLWAGAIKPGLAQTPLKRVFSDDFSKELGFMADIMYNANNGQHREWAADQVEDLIKDQLSSGKFLESLGKIPWFQIQSPSDSSFALITWQFEKADGMFSPRGLIVFNSGKFVHLENDPEIWQDPEYERFEGNQWPGAVYYQMHSFEHGKDTLYILFGYHGWDGKNRLRIVEIMEAQDGIVQFGAPVLIMDADSVRPDARYRKVLKYSAQSNVRIQYEDSLKMIMMDHLIPARTPEGDLSWVPDGSYEAFELRDGRWYFVEKVFHQTQDVPPGSPRVETEKRDLFGRKQ